MGIKCVMLVFSVYSNYMNRIKVILCVKQF